MRKLSISLKNHLVVDQKFYTIPMSNLVYRLQIYETTDPKTKVYSSFFIDLSLLKPICQYIVPLNNRMNKNHLLWTKIIFFLEFSLKFDK